MKSKSSFAKTFFPLTVFVLLTFFLSGNTLAQQVFTGEINKTYKVTMNDGSVITGKLLQMTDSEIVISSGTMGDIHLQRQNIKSVTEVLAIDDKKSGAWFANPNYSRYLLSNSAIPMDKHTGYYQNTWIFVNTFSYAFTKNISMAGGFEIISIMAGEEGVYGFYLNPKASFRLADNFYAGTSILYANTIKTADDFGGLATVNGFATYGNRNNNLTAAIGWGWADGEFSSMPLMTVSGMVRASRRIAFVSENWIIPILEEDFEGGESRSYYGIFSYGIRFLGEKMSVDLAFINNPDIAKDIFLGVPWLDFVVNF